MLITDRVINLIEKRTSCWPSLKKVILARLANGMGSQMLRPPVLPTECTAD